MSASGWNPWNDLSSNGHELSSNGHEEERIGDMFGRTLMRERVVHALPLDIRQTEDAFCIEASVAGFRPEDVEITFDEGVLTIRGIRPQMDESWLGGYVQRERHLSSVHGRVHLSTQVRVEEITAAFENGILTIMVPREQRTEPKRIPVTVGRFEQHKEVPYLNADGTIAQRAIDTPAVSLAPG